MQKEAVVDYSDVKLPNGIWLVGLSLREELLYATAVMGPVAVMRQLVDQDLNDDPISLDIDGLGKCELVAVVKEPAPTILPGADGIGVLMGAEFQLRVVEPYDSEPPGVIYYDNMPLGSLVLLDVTLHPSATKESLGAMEVKQIAGPAKEVAELLNRCRGADSYALQVGQQAIVTPRGMTYEIHEELDGIGFVRDLSVVGEVKFSTIQAIQENEAEGGEPDLSAPLFSSEEAQKQAGGWADALRHAYLICADESLISLNDQIVNRPLYNLPQLEDDLMAMLKAFMRKRAVTRYISKPEFTVIESALTDVARLAVTSGVLRYYSEAFTVFLESDNGCPDIASD